MTFTDAFDPKVSEARRRREWSLSYLGLRYPELRSNGKTYQAAVADLVEEMDRSERTVSGWLFLLGLTAK